MGHTSHLSGHGRYRDQSVIVPGTRTIDPANPADIASHETGWSLLWSDAHPSQTPT